MYHCTPTLHNYKYEYCTVLTHKTTAPWESSKREEELEAELSGLQCLGKSDGGKDSVFFVLF